MSLFSDVLYKVLTPVSDARVSALQREERFAEFRDVL
jgi:hypothetical protein